MIPKLHPRSTEFQAPGWIVAEGAMTTAGLPSSAAMPGTSSRRFANSERHRPGSMSSTTPRSSGFACADVL